ncbi:MAG TPA: universal stress protein [Ectothiorhodospiraceae bacterium]|nr:universal stress protein [Ectothiorhodospiraceae bacterium]
MAGYKQILVAVDFSEHSERALARGLELSHAIDAKVNMIHVVDYFPMMDAAYDGALTFSVDITDELVASSKKRLAELADKYHLSEEQLFVEVGAIRNEIIDRAEKIAADLIVIGSHGWRGLDLLLGATTDSVLHHAKCDVLVVRP